jgi:CheY-like chemotaxis protein
VVLSFADDGMGMSEETQSRVFEPFYTTKVESEGTGLGMSTAYGIIKQSGGGITVSSAEGQGTTFSIYLPETQSLPVKAVRGDWDPSTRRELRGTETILLVEDDERVRSAIRRLLETLGYTVFCASDAGEAVAVCQRKANGVRLVLTDIVMPGAMSGVQLVEWLRQNRPRVSVVAMSGHAEEALRKAGLDHLDVPLVQKPFSLDTLARAVRQALD